MCHMICTTCHMFFVCLGLIEVITCFYLKLIWLYIGIMPDEDLWLLIINKFIWSSYFQCADFTSSFHQHFWYHRHFCHRYHKNTNLNNKNNKKDKQSVSD